MRRKVFALAAMATGMVGAQTNATNGWVSGVVKDKVTGQPLAHYTVSTNPGNKELTSTTDSSGRYRLSGLAPGSYRFTARDSQRAGNDFTREVVLSGSGLDNIDFLVLQDGMITGKVVDENKEPVPGVTVRLVSREYYGGSLGYYYAGSTARTNGLGVFALVHVRPERAYLVLVDRAELNLAANSAVPLDQKLRKQIVARTWYPNSPVKNGAQAVILRPGERRDGVDIEIGKSPSYCVEGTARGPLKGAELRFSVADTQVASGASATSGSGGAVPSGVTAADGIFRVCDLYSGVYRLSVEDPNRKAQSPPSFGVAEITIADRDLRGVTVVATPGKPLDGEVAWDSDPPPTPVSARLRLMLAPLYAVGPSGGSAGAESAIPGTFALHGITPDDYVVRSVLNAPGLYVKDITYAGRSVRNEPLHLGTVMNGAGLRVVMAHDGATLNVQVTDRDGNSGSDLRVLLFPADVPSEVVLASRLIEGRTNQLGQYASPVLPPGRYCVMATEEAVDPTPESMGRLWRARHRFQVVDLAPSGTAQLKLEPGKIE